MKWLLLILILSASGCHRNSVTVSEEDISADILYVKGTYRPFTGKCVVLYRNTDIVKEEFTYTRGRLNGEATTWYKNGNISRKGNYTHGHISGNWIFWDENGNKVIEAAYKYDSLSGSYLSLYTNGNIKEKGHYSGDRRTGKWEYYDERGQLQSRVR